MSDPDLFGVRKKPRAKKPPAPNGAVQRLIGIYVAEYERLTGEKPVISKADGPLLKKLILDYGEEKTEQRLRAFMKLNDPFVRDSGYAIRVFYSKWNELAMRLKPARTVASHGEIPDADATKKMLERLRVKK